MSQKNKPSKKNKEEKSIVSLGRKNILSKKQLQKSFDKQLNEFQSQMTPANRLLSKIFHSHSVEGISEFISRTLATPYALLFGSISAFIGVGGTYVIAINYGYELSGFEALLAFIIGWLLGIFYDFIRIRKSKL